MQLPQQILQQYWHHQNFRGEQEAIIQAVIEQQSVLALLPTGGGKSICFQVPTLLQNGLCIVVSPLIALMKDQVENLEKKKISAAAIHSGLAKEEVENLLIKAANGDYNFLYLSPERLDSSLFKAYLPDLSICLLAIDEAHCISQWGFDFRPAYLKIIEFINAIPNVPVIALTASATKLVQQDIVDQLQLKKIKIFKQSFERPNISYAAFLVDVKLNKVVDILQKVSGSSIVYCSNRRRTKLVAELLQQQQISADYYHAGLSQKERNTKQQNWIQNKTRVIVCTNAFGMGIDKTNVKTVIHYDVPECLENYYQEAGRAGRDGTRAFAVLLYTRQDINALKTLPDLRYPPIEIIKKVYQFLADFLHIPVGIGEGNSYDFDIQLFIKNFNIDIITTNAVLKILEQDGHIVCTDNFFTPSKVSIAIDRFSLENFEQTHPTLEPLLKTLLRTYEGIFDNEHIVYEKQIAKTLRLEEGLVKQQLQLLKQYQIITYTEQKETPQLYFLVNRAPANYLLINEKKIAERKQIFTTRIHKMVEYATLKTSCRSNFLASYFNATELQSCGVCDNCLSLKRTPLTKVEFIQIEKEIRTILSSKSYMLKELQLKLIQYNSEKIHTVIQFLLEQHIIQSSEDKFSLTA